MTSDTIVAGPNVVRATRHADPQSTIAGAEYWSYRVVHGPGLTPTESEQVHDRLRTLEPRKRSCSCGGPETCAIPDDCQRSA